jgi:serine/threonine protein kinase
MFLFVEYFFLFDRNQNGDILYIVMEYCGGGDLDSLSQVGLSIRSWSVGEPTDENSDTTFAWGGSAASQQNHAQGHKGSQCTV